MNPFMTTGNRMQPGFRFQDPRQERIFRRLGLIGPGPAAFFRDACHLMTGDLSLSSTSHLVAHLLRDIESAIRRVLLHVSRNVPEAKEKGKDGNEHKRQILAVLKDLGVEPTSAVAREWLGLSGPNNDFGLAARAHRDALSQPRPVDDQYEEFWETCLRILDTVLQRFEERYLLTIDALDKLLAKSNPTTDDVETLRNCIPNSPVNMEYFFSRLDNAGWLIPLANGGFFRYPPPPVAQGDGMTFPYWPESQYLARMASRTPEIVIEVAKRILAKDNIRVHEDIVDMALAMPPHMAAQLVPLAKAGLDSPYTLLLPDALGKLITHLAQGGQVEDALGLARDLLNIRPDPRATDDTDENWMSRPEPQPLFEVWEYGKILADEMPHLVEAAGERALNLLCDLLETATRLSMRPGRENSESDISYVWRLEIAVDEKHRSDVRNMLVSAVRDAAEGLMACNGREVLSIVEGRPYKVFVRIGLHLRCRWPEVDLEGTAALVQNDEIRGDIDLWHEFFHLLKQQYGRLPLHAQGSYLDWVQKGPNTAKWTEPRQNGTERVPTAEEVAARIRNWQYRRLTPIQEYLQGAWRRQFEALRQEFGELKHPDYHFYMSSSWVGPTSPKSNDELAAMTVEELAGFLSSWKPSPDWMSPTPEGLARQLQTVVAANPEGYAAQAERFQGLDPTYLRGILTGLENAAKESRQFSWQAVLAICQWAVAQLREIPGRNAKDGDLDPHWGWTRKAIANLLEVGFASGPSEVPYSYRFTAWAVLQPLLEDPEPTPAYEAENGGSNMDPATLSINTVRGQAMHAAVCYALWVRKHDDQVTGEEERSRGFAMMPEVREVLDRHLDRDYDPSPAVHSVYGRWFPWLVYLDPDWASANVHRIFPTESALLPLRDAAWSAYVVYWSAHPDAVGLLQGEYLAAIDRIGYVAADRRCFADPDEHLAQHIMSLYCQGILSLDAQSGLLGRFYAKAPDSLCAHASNAIGRGMHGDTDPLPPEVADRLVALWHHRLCIALSDNPASHAAELSEFGWWFSSAKFDTAWSVAQLKQVLQVTTNIQLDNLVVAQLAVHCAEFPLDCVECLSLLTEGEPSWRFYGWEDYPRKILATALGSSSVEARQAATELINRLGARGNLQFRDLLSGQLT
ncbi:MAG: hypothetical protein ACYC4R_13520 [Anaerolineae bacterium]